MPKITYDIPLSAGSITNVYTCLDDVFSKAYDFETELLCEKNEKIEFICKNSYRVKGGPIAVFCDISYADGKYILTVSPQYEERKKVSAAALAIIALAAVPVSIITKNLAVLFFLIIVSAVFLTGSSKFVFEEENRILEYIDKAVKRMV